MLNEIRFYFISEFFCLYLIRVLKICKIMFLIRMRFIVLEFIIIEFRVWNCGIVNGELRI